jgi:DNA-binding response OmpR family regulator
MAESDIMIVDDNPANLKLLEDMLLQRGYEVRSFPLGRLALAAATKNPPDLILLDINMPEMDGYQVCERLKSTPGLSDIPVIFLSALNETEDKVRAFRCGGVDYISKPFQFEEVQARVETQVKLRHAQQAERALLERTLGGAIGTLWELVQLTSPVLAMRSHSIRDIVLWVAKRIGIEEPWQYELAATLCLLGCIALPDQVFERAYCGQDLSPDEDRMFRAHPERAARLLSKIPRLEVVAEIIRGQQSPKAVSTSKEESQQGALMLHLALELDRRIYRGNTAGAAIAELRRSSEFTGPMLDALQSYSPAQAEHEVRRLPIRELRSGMILERDVLSTDSNLLIFKKGTTLTETWIERMVNFAKAPGLREPVEVRVPRLAGARKLEEFVYGATGTGAPNA